MSIQPIAGFCWTGASFKAVKVHIDVERLAKAVDRDVWVISGFIYGVEHLAADSVHTHDGDPAELEGRVIDIVRFLHPSSSSYSWYLLIVLDS
mgnify:CR=1 FL=1